MRVKGSLEVAKKARTGKPPVPLSVLSQPMSILGKKLSSHNSINNDDMQCQHVTKSVNFSLLKKNLKDHNFSECTSCIEAKKKPATQSSLLPSTQSPSSETPPTYWLCLFCGHQGCDRNSEHQHAIKHYKTPRSDNHCICINTETWIIWCYECDNEVTHQTRQLEDIVSYVQKLKSQSKTTDSSKASSLMRLNSQTLQIQQQIQQQAIKTDSNAPQTNGKRASISFASSQQSLTTSYKVTGLSNLGNTCFFNAVLQNIAQTPCLDQLLQKNLSTKDKTEVIKADFENESNENSGSGENTSENEYDRRVSRQTTLKTSEHLSINIGEPGAMCMNLYTLVKEMNNAKSNSVLSPGAVFSLVCKKVPSFKGYQQQDSHELLRHLLDAIKADEIKRRQAGILSALNINVKSGVTEALKQKIKQFGRCIDYTFIDSLFGGHLVSSIYCEQCKTCSQNIEPFLDLSLPIVDERSVQLSAQYRASNAKAAVVEDYRDSDNYVSKNKLKKQRQLAKKSSKSNRAKTTKKSDENWLKSSNGANSGGEEQDDADDEDGAISANEDDNSDDIEMASMEKVINELSDNDWKVEAMQSLGNRSTSNQIEEGCTLNGCLLQFTSSEQLSGSNKFGCENCTKIAHRKSGSKEMKTVYTQAKKQYLICELPAVLTIHLKRFQQLGFRLEKVNKHVNFPLELDMSPYTSKMCVNLNNSSKIIYSLYGVVEHSGKLNGGHYTAYVKARQKPNIEKFLGKKRISALRQSTTMSGDDGESLSGAASAVSDSSSYNWYYISDSHVTEVPESKITRVQAYILFYERVV